jgi:hypothetical protein
MPRNGATIFSDLIDKLDAVRVTCERWALSSALVIMPQPLERKTLIQKRSRMHSSAKGAVRFAHRRNAMIPAETIACHTGRI